MGPVGTGDWGLGLGLDNLAVTINVVYSAISGIIFDIHIFVHSAGIQVTVVEH